MDFARSEPLKGLPEVSQFAAPSFPRKTDVWRKGLFFLGCMNILLFVKRGEVYIQ